MVLGWPSAVSDQLGKFDRMSRGGGGDMVLICTCLLVVSSSTTAAGVSSAGALKLKQACSEVASMMD